MPPLFKPMTDSTEYQRGYVAGRKRSQTDFDVDEARKSRKERVYLKCLELSLKHCSGWTIGGEKINNAEGYCKIAKIFSDNSISKIDL